MSERPILFSAPMVRAILAGTKTQTRRPVKGAPDDWAPTQPQVFAPTVVDRYGEEQPGPDTYGAGNADGDCWIRCPYGQPGDRLWVREAYMPDPPDDGTWAGTAWRGCKDSRLEDIPERFRTPAHCIHRATWQGGDLVGWRPSIHMPRWASRITLEITGVRVERLNDITDADAAAEGWPGFDGTSLDSMAWFSELWESINGPSSWAANPWVWCVEFRRLEAGNV